MPLNELLKTSDIVSIHSPLNSNTKNLIAEKQLNLMKETAYLINVGRGGIVNEMDLANALNNNQIAGAGLDVMEVEPINADNPLLKLNNPDKIVMTPHNAWTSNESRSKLINEIALNIEAFQNNQLRNRIC
jgi:glycerate dehydrogenase